MGGEFFIALLSVSRDADRTDDFSVVITDQHTAAFRKDLIGGGAHQILHEQRPFFGADAD